MSHQGLPPTPGDQGVGGDPWRVIGYLIAGVAFYGILGWLADTWFGTSFLVGVGIVLGAVLGVYLTYARFGKQ